MSWTTIGDALQYHRLRQDGDQLKSQMARLTTELSTGRQADLGRATGGNFSVLSGIEHGLKLTETFKFTIAEATLDANVRQNALEKVEGEVAGFGPEILSLAASGGFVDMMLTISNSGDRLNQAVSALNTRTAGKSLFAGDAPDQAALISGDEILAELRPLVATATDGADMIAIVDDWFMASGGGYETIAWQGGSGTAAPVILAEGVQEELGITALEPALREILSGLALAALVSEASGPSTDTERRAIATGAASRMQSGETSLIILRSDLGASQARIESARVEMEATRHTLELEHSRLTGVDPYRTATDLEAVQARLESLYILTARMSRLTLSEYLR